MNMTDVELAYAAGIIDGEGSIGIRKRAFVATQGYSMVVDVGNTSMVLLEWLHARWNGSLRQLVERNEKHRPVSSWHISGNVALPFLVAVRPFLVVKTRQADIAIEFQALKAAQPHRGRHPRAYALTQRYELLYARLRQINRRGRIVPTQPILPAIDDLPFEEVHAEAV